METPRLYQRVTGDPAEAPARILLFGEPGSGKTTEAAQWAPNFDWFTTDPDGMRALALHLKHNPDKVITPKAWKEGAEGLVHPNKMRVWLLNETFDENGVETTDYFQVVLQVCQKLREPQCRGAVIDEGNEFIRRLLRSANMGNRTVPTQARFPWATNAFLQVVITAKNLRKGLVLLHHKREARYHEPVERKSGEVYVPPNNGEIKYPAGPKSPGGNMIKDIAAHLDLVWEMVLEADDIGDDAPERYLLTQESNLCFRKTRADWKDHVENRLELGLRARLTELGYKNPPPKDIDS